MFFFLFSYSFLLRFAFPALSLACTCAVHLPPVCFNICARNVKVLGLLLLKVGQFQFPLTPDVPVLAMRPGYYVLPTPEPDVFYGVVFSKNLPDAYVAAFETLIETRCALRRLPAEQSAKLPPLPGDDDLEPAAAAPLSDSKVVSTNVESNSRTVATLSAASSTVESGSERIARGVTATGSWLAQKVGQGGSALREVDSLLLRSAPVRLACCSRCLLTCSLSVFCSLAAPCARRKAGGGQSARRENNKSGGICHAAPCLYFKHRRRRAGRFCRRERKDCGRARGSCNFVRRFA